MKRKWKEMMWNEMMWNEIKCIFNCTCDMIENCSAVNACCKQSKHDALVYRTAQTHLHMLA